MFTRLNSAVRSTAILTFALAIAMPAAAQRAQTDGRWQAWIGCWQPAGTLIRVVGKSANAVTCVVPASTPSSVDVITLSGGKVVDRTHVDTDGQQHPLTKDGCTGWQSAKWSPTGRRVYLKSEFNCNGAPTTQVSGLYAMAGSGEWIDVQGMRVAKNSGVHSVRYRGEVDPGPLPEEITQKLQEHTIARAAAMLAVTTRPTLTDVEEASRELDPAVVSTWLIDAQQASFEKPEPLNAKQLEQLADHGVPADVIDVMLSLSYPNVLAVNTTGTSVMRQNGDSVNGRYSNLLASAANPVIGIDRFGFPIYASESLMMAGCSPFMYGLDDAAWNFYNYGMGGCGGYGYSAFGMYPGYYGFGGYGYAGYPYGYGGGYYGGVPVVVPVNNGNNGTPAPSHGRVVNGRGYTQGGNGSSGTASPRGDMSPSGSSGGMSPSGGSGSSAPPARTAQPRKP